MNAVGLTVFGIVIGATFASAVWLLIGSPKEKGENSNSNVRNTATFILALVFSAIAWGSVFAILERAGITLSEPTAWGEAPVRNILIGVASFFAIPIGAVTLANAYNRTQILQTQSDQSQRRLEAELISEAVRLTAAQEPASQIGGILTLERLAKSNSDIFYDVQQTLESFVRTQTSEPMIEMDELEDELRTLKQVSEKDEAQKERVSRIKYLMSRIPSGNDTEAIQVAVRVLFRTFATRGATELDLRGAFLRSQYHLTDAVSNITFDGSYIKWLTFSGRTGEISLQGRKYGGNIFFKDANAKSVAVSGSVGWMCFERSEVASLKLSHLNLESLTWKHSKAKFEIDTESNVKISQYLDVDPIKSDLKLDQIDLDYISRIDFPEEAELVEVVEFLSASIASKYFHELRPKIFAGEIQSNWPLILSRYEGTKES